MEAMRHKSAAMEAMRTVSAACSCVGCACVRACVRACVHVFCARMCVFV
jgi:hypothetical protein